MSIVLNIFLIILLLISTYFWYVCNVSIKNNPIGKYANQTYIIHFLSKWTSIIIIIILIYRFF